MIHNIKLKKNQPKNYVWLKYTQIDYNDHKLSYNLNNYEKERYGEDDLWKKKMWE